MDTNIVIGIVGVLIAAAGLAAAVIGLRHSRQQSRIATEEREKRRQEKMKEPALAVGAELITPPPSHVPSYGGKHPQGIIYVRVANTGGKVARDVAGRLFFDSECVELLGIEVERQPLTEQSHRIAPDTIDRRYRVQLNIARMAPKPFTQLGLQFPVRFRSRGLTKVGYILVADNADTIQGELNLEIPNEAE